MPEAIRNKHLLTFDILKGIVIWMIILVHSRQKFDGLNIWLGVFDVGQMGCQMFFVISGMASMMSYKRLAGQPHAKQEFYKKRLTAIIPGWYAAIFLAYILNTLSLAFLDMNIGFAVNRQPLSILCNLLLLHGLLPFCNNNVAAGGWFIGTVILFYLAVPFLYKFMAQRKQSFVKYIPWIAEAAACVCIVGLYLLTRRKHGYAALKNNGFIYFSFVNQMGCFLLGVSLYFEKETKNIVIEKILCILDAFLLLFVFFSGWKLAFVMVPFIMGLLTYHLIRWMLFLEERGDVSFGKSKIMKILKAYGQNSYYIYLIHGLFVWSMPLVLHKLLSALGLYINDNLLYLILIIPMFVLSYYTALLFHKMITAIKNLFPKS